MAFFDNLKNKTISMGNQVSDMARNSSEQWKLEGEIRKLNADIDAVYMAIGKAVFDERMTGEKADPEEQIRAILDLKKQIEEKEQKIDEIKSRIPCPNCGKIMPAGTNFCTYCGSPMEKQEQEPVRGEELRCPNCGRPVQPSHAFCMNCGAKLKAPEPEPEEAGAAYAEESGAAYQEEAPAENTAPEWFEDKAPAEEEAPEPYPYENTAPETGEATAPDGEV